MITKTREDFHTFIKDKDMNKYIYFNPDIKTKDWEIANRSWLKISNNEIKITQSSSELWKKSKHWSIKNFIEIIKQYCKEDKIQNINNLKFDYIIDLNKKWELLIKNKLNTPFLS